MTQIYVPACQAAPLYGKHGQGPVCIQRILFQNLGALADSRLVSTVRVCQKGTAVLEVIRHLTGGGWVAGCTEERGERGGELCVFMNGGLDLCTRCHHHVWSGGPVSPT